MINLFPTVSWVPNPPQPLATNTGRLTRRMCGTLSKTYSCTLVQDLIQPHSKNTQLDHKGKRCRQKNQCQASSPSPSSEGIHTSMLLSPTTNNVTSNFASQGPQQGFRTQGFYRSRSHGHPLLVSTTILHSQKQACARYNHTVQANNLGPPLSLREWNKSKFQMPSMGQACNSSKEV